jgi:hypothetical protein
VKVIVQPDWDLLAAIDAAYDGYVGGGKSSKGHRMSVLMAWANVVGRARAVRDLEALYVFHGTRKAFAAWLGVGPATLKRVDERFRIVPEHTVRAAGSPSQDLLDTLTYRGPLGEGAFGQVWRARDALGRDVAVKFMHPEDDNDPAALEHARALGPVSTHPNIVTVHYCSYLTPPTGGARRLGVVMEYVDGEALVDRLSKALSPSQASTIVVGLSGAIAHIHDQGMVHGDLHASNVLIRVDGSPVVIDLANRAALSSFHSNSIDKGTDATRLADIFRSVLENVRPGLGARLGRVLTVPDLRLACLETLGSLDGSNRAPEIVTVGQRFLSTWVAIERLVLQAAPGGAGRRVVISVAATKLVEGGLLDENTARQLVRLQHLRNEFVHRDPSIVRETDLRSATQVLEELKQAVS